MNEGVKTCGKPSRGRYNEGCRCFMCRAANSQYEYERSNGIGKRAMVGEAETAEARRRVERWRARGIGLRTISDYTGVSRSSLRYLVTGKGTHGDGSKPTARMKRESYEAIISANPVKRGRWIELPNPPSQVSALSDWEWAEAERSYATGELSAAKIAERYRAVSEYAVRKHMERAGVRPRAWTEGSES